MLISAVISLQPMAYLLIFCDYFQALVFMIFYPETEPLRADAYNWGLPLPANHDGDFPYS